MASGTRKSEPTTAQSPDWIQIEVDYRAGIKTLRQIADEHSISHVAINKRAKRDGWTRDIAAKIQAKQGVPLAPKDEMSTAGFVYVIFIDSGVRRFYKIGMAKRFDARFDQHQCASPFDICVAICYFTGNMRLEEKYLHAQFSEKRVRGEWFELTGEDLVVITQRALLV
jgi:hypothetical protein